MSALRVQCSPLSGNIYAGRINKSGDAWSRDPVDVTSDVIGSIIQKIGAGNAISVNENGKPAFEIEVRDVRVAAPLPAEQPSNPVPLDEHTRFILGRPNFTCIRAANRMRELGHEIERKAEAEQAAVIHLMLTMYFKHGAGWMEHCNTYLARIVGQQTKGGGNG